MLCTMRSIEFVANTNVSAVSYTYYNTRMQYSGIVILDVVHNIVGYNIILLLFSQREIYSDPRMKTTKTHHIQHFNTHEGAVAKIEM